MRALGSAISSYETAFWVELDDFATVYVVDLFIAVVNGKLEELASYPTGKPLSIIGSSARSPDLGFQLSILQSATKKCLLQIRAPYLSREPGGCRPSMTRPWN